jgi:hypothetical protein
VRVVGIDDWTWQKSQQHFGTILMDLERGASWICYPGGPPTKRQRGWPRRPTITIISRDRHGPRLTAQTAGGFADRQQRVVNREDGFYSSL